ncbi:hypothetical protein JB92DRAFT_2177931 [Gautieria morchelliformis]|nr:hypothetical protein JB92DRAFT_2177931 [Gautieria morchelliformis]
MLGIALSLLFISAINAFDMTLPTTLPLSAPLPNGTMEIQVNCSVTVEVKLKIGVNTGEVSAGRYRTALFTP